MRPPLTLLALSLPLLVAFAPVQEGRRGSDRSDAKDEGKKGSKDDIKPYDDVVLGRPIRRRCSSGICLPSRCASFWSLRLVGVVIREFDNYVGRNAGTRVAVCQSCGARCLASTGVTNSR